MCRFLSESHPATSSVDKDAASQVMSSARFEEIISALDLDDSVCTVIECERQHGSLRVGYGTQLKALARQCVRNFLREWLMEHRSRDLGESSPHVEERLREVVRLQALVQRESKRARKRPNTARNAFATAKDSEDRRRLGKRSVQEFHANKAAWGRVWDELPLDHPERRKYLDEFAENSREYRLLKRHRASLEFEAGVVNSAVSSGIGAGSAELWDCEETPLAKSALGIGSFKWPLSARILDRWREKNSWSLRGAFEKCELLSCYLAARCTASKLQDHIAWILGPKNPGGPRCVLRYMLSMSLTQLN
jgi:hypothetical protein